MCSLVAKFSNLPLVMFAIVCMEFDKDLIWRPVVLLSLWDNEQIRPNFNPRQHSVWGRRWVAATMSPDQISLQVSANVTTICSQKKWLRWQLLKAALAWVSARDEQSWKGNVAMWEYGRDGMLVLFYRYYSCLRCYVDDSNTCSDSKLSNYGSPYNWSCQACRGEFSYILYSNYHS